MQARGGAAGFGGRDWVFKTALGAQATGTALVAQKTTRHGFRRPGKKMGCRRFPGQRRGHAEQDGETEIDKTSPDSNLAGSSGLSGLVRAGELLRTPRHVGKSAALCAATAPP